MPSVGLALWTGAHAFVWAANVVSALCLAKRSRRVRGRDRSRTESWGRGLSWGVWWPGANSMTASAVCRRSASVVLLATYGACRTSGAGVGAGVAAASASASNSRCFRLSCLPQLCSVGRQKHHAWCHCRMAYIFCFAFDLVLASRVEPQHATACWEIGGTMCTRWS